MVSSSIQKKKKCYGTLQTIETAMQLTSPLQYQEIEDHLHDQ